MSISNITVKINGNDYPMTCAAGEEDKIMGLAARIDSEVRDLAKASGSIGESRLLAMTLLVVMDRVQDLESEVSAKVESGVEPTIETVSTPSIDETAVINLINQLTQRLEKLASNSN